MRRMEYEEASSLNMLVLMDRKITMDLTLGMKIPPSTIAIVKDFDQMERKKSRPARCSLVNVNRRFS